MKNINKSIAVLSLCFLCLFLVKCKKEEPPAPPPVVEVNIPAGDGFEKLSEYNFFLGDLKDLESNTPAGVIPYDLNMALFSDYAIKRRFVFVPAGMTIPFNADNVFDFPNGSVLIKHFQYEPSPGEDLFIETRLLIKTADGWQAESYEWNNEQTEAFRTIVGSTRELTTTVNSIPQTFNYLVPNQNQCKNCHENNGVITPIGPRAANLNKTYNYSTGIANQLEYWRDAGFFTSVDLGADTYPQIDDISASLDKRARAYLAVNCASCHSTTGAAENSGLYLEYHNTDSLSIGFFKGPIAAGQGSGGFSYVINPGVADSSILLHRMKADAVDERMPEIGRELLHQEGISLIEEWINSF